MRFIDIEANSVTGIDGLRDGIVRVGLDMSEEQMRDLFECIGSSVSRNTLEQWVARIEETA